MDELIRERFFAPPPRPPRRPYPYALILERRRVLEEALKDAPIDPTTHRAPRRP